MSDGFNLNFDEPKKPDPPAYTPRPIPDPYRPQYQPVVPVAPYKPKPKSKLLEYAGWGSAACGIIFLSMFGGFLIGCSTADPMAEVDLGSTGANAAAEFVRDYRQGMSELYAECSRRLHVAEDDPELIRDIQDARDFIKANKDSIRNNAFRPIGKQLESINGDKWTIEKADNVFTNLSEGFVQ